MSSFEGLWWQPNLNLYEALEIGDAKHVSEEVIKKQLDAHTEWVLRTVAGFKTPNSASKAAVNSSDKIDVGGGRKIKVVAILRGPTAEVSEYLGLDEIQAHILLRRFLDAEGILVDQYPKSCDEGFLEKVAVYYFQERQWLLRVVHVLLRSGEDGGEEGRAYSTTVSATLDALLGKGLEDTLFQLLSDYADQAAAPTGKRPASGALAVPAAAAAAGGLSAAAPMGSPLLAARAAHYDLWARQAVQEEVLVLESLFLLYYSLRPCSSARWVKLAGAVHKGLLALPIEQVALLSGAARGGAEHAQHLGALLLVEALDMERVLQLVCDAAPLDGAAGGEGEGHEFKAAGVREVDQVVKGWWDSATPLHGPVLLAWGTFTCLAGGLPGGGDLNVQHAGHAAAAQRCGALGGLLAALRLPSLCAGDEAHATGYRSVLKNLLAASLAAFEEESVGGGTLLVDILCQLFEGQRGLCEQFWDTGDLFDAPIRRLLGRLRALAPALPLPAARLLSALAEGGFASQCALEYLCGAPAVTGAHAPAELVGVARALGSGPEVVAAAPIPLPGATGFLVPSGTRGVLLGQQEADAAGWVGAMGAWGGDRGLVLIEWHVAERLGGAAAGAGYAVLVSAVAERASAGPRGLPEEQAGELRAMLRLVERLVRGCPVLGSRASAARVAAGGRAVDILGLACAVVGRWSGASAPHERAVLAAALALAGALGAQTHARALALLSQTPLLACPAGPAAASLEGAASLGGLHSVVLHECAAGEYPVTLALLGAVAGLVGGGARQAPVPAFVGFAVAVLARHASWRYRESAERWQVAGAALSVVRLALGASGGAHGPSALPPLRHQLLAALTQPGAAGGVLQGALSVDAAELEAMCRAGSREAFAVEEAAWQGLSVLPLVLEGAAEVGAPPGSQGGAGGLDAAVFHHATRGASPAASVAASFVSYLYSSALRRAAVGALGALCVAASRFHPYPIPVAACLPHDAPSLGGGVGQRTRSSLVTPASCSSLRSSPGAFLATLELLATAVACQPGLADLMLFPCAMDTGGVFDPPAAAGCGGDASRARAVGAAIEAAGGSKEAAGKAGGAKPWSCLDGLLECVHEGAALKESFPREAARVLRVLCDLWAQRRGGVAAPAEVLRRQPGLWKALGAILPTRAEEDADAKAAADAAAAGSAPAAEADRAEGAGAHSLACEAMVLRVLAEESLRSGGGAPGVGGAAAAAAEALVKGWAEDGSGRLRAWVRRFSRPRYHPGRLAEAHAAMRLAAVRLLISAEEEGHGGGGGGGVEGVHAGLVDAAVEAAAPVLASAHQDGLGAALGGHAPEARLLLLQQLLEDMRAQAVRGEDPPPSPPSRRVLLAAASRQCLECALLWSTGGGAGPGSSESYGGDFLYDLTALGASLWEGRAEGWWGTLPSPESGALAMLRRASAMASEADAALLGLRGLRALFTTAAGAGGGRQAAGGLASWWPAAEVRGALSDVLSTLADLAPRLEADRAMAEGSAWYAQLLARKGAGREGFVTAHASELAEMALLLVRLLCKGAEGDRGGGAAGVGSGPLPAMEGEDVALCGSLMDAVVAAMDLYRGGGWRGAAGEPAAEPRPDAGAVEAGGAAGVLPPLLAALLMMLQRGASSPGAAGQEVRSKLSAGCAKVLPLLCHLCHPRSRVSGAAMSALGLVCRSYLEPASWQPIICRHLSLGQMLRPLPPVAAPGVWSAAAAGGGAHLPGGGGSSGDEESALMLALVLSRSPAGAHLLHTQGALPRLQAVAAAILAEGGAAGAPGTPPHYAPNGSRDPRHHRWVSLLSLLGALLRSLAGNAGAEEQAVSLLASLDGRLLAALRPPAGPGARLTLAWLEEAEATAFLLVQYARFVGRWQLALPKSPQQFRRAAGAFLTFVADAGISGLRPLPCPPVSPAELAAHEAAGPQCGEGWFGGAAAAAAAGVIKGAAPLTPPPLRTSSSLSSAYAAPAAPPPPAAAGTEFSARVAEKVYSASRHLACFLCSVTPPSPAGAEGLSPDSLAVLREQCGAVAEELAGAGAPGKGGPVGRAYLAARGVSEMAACLQELAGAKNPRQQ